MAPKHMKVSPRFLIGQTVRVDLNNQESYVGKLMSVENEGNVIVFGCDKFVNNVFTENVGNAFIPGFKIVAITPCGNVNCKTQPKESK